MCDFCEEQREKSELEYKGIYLQYVYKEEKKAPLLVYTRHDLEVNFYTFVERQT